MLNSIGVEQEIVSRCRRSQTVEEVLLDLQIISNQRLTIVLLYVYLDSALGLGTIRNFD
jgi:hypothetical protein